MIQIFGNIVELTNGRKLYDITPKIKDWINAEQINTGLLTINIKHTSASLLVNENYELAAKIRDDISRLKNTDEIK